MFVKIYSYQIRKGKVKEFLNLQEEISKIYREQIKYKAIFLENRDNPGLILEIHWYHNEDDYIKSMNLINSKKLIKNLWGEFLNLLEIDPKKIDEQYYNQIRYENYLK